MGNGCGGGGGEAVAAILSLLELELRRRVLRESDGEGSAHITLPLNAHMNKEIVNISIMQRFKHVTPRKQDRCSKKFCQNLAYRSRAFVSHKGITYQQCGPHQRLVGNNRKVGPERGAAVRAPRELRRARSDGLNLH